MPTNDILDLFIEERDRLNRAIEVVQSPARRGGRAYTTSTNTIMDGATPRRGGMSLAARKAQSRRMTTLGQRSVKLLSRRRSPSRFDSFSSGPTVTALLASLIIYGSVRNQRRNDQLFLDADIQRKFVFRQNNKRR